MAKEQKLFAREGRVNGTKPGKTRSTYKGRVNGTGRGKVNGFKKQSKPTEREAGPSRLRTMIGGRITMWQLLVLFVVVILIVSTMLIVFSRSPQAGTIEIDGYFEDWEPITSYKLSQFIPGILDGVDESKLSFEQEVPTGKLYLYLELQDTMFSGSEMSTLYVFIDTDADATTGYATSKSRGADLLLLFSGVNGSIVESVQARYVASEDHNDWNSWQSFSGINYAFLGTEMEISIDVLLMTPLVELATYIWGEEHNSPVLSSEGTILIKQEPLIHNSVTTAASPNVMRVSFIAMGTPAQEYTVQPVLVTEDEGEFKGVSIEINTVEWTTQDLSVDLTSIGPGQSFSFSFTGVAEAFIGTVDVMGRSCSGYYMSPPTSIVADGLFIDWNARKCTDTDSVAVTNPGIDIREYGAASQNESYFVYVGTVGDALEGSNVPEKRKKSTGGQGGGSVVKLRKTGEDLLQAYIDKDPSTDIGDPISAENMTIEADFLVEVYGRNGIVTQSAVKKWSVTSDEWVPVGLLETFGVGTFGVEFSVSKFLLGNLTNSEIIFFTTDWKGQSDNCWLNGALTDPWVVRGTSSSAATYRSNDGIAWTNAGSITLLAGETVVSIAHSLDRSYVFAVTNTGRVFDWHVNVDSSWGPEVTGPCNSTSVVGIAPNSVTGEGGCLILSSNGWTWTTATLGGSRGWTNSTTKVAQGYTDFKDVCFNATGGRYWAVRSATDSSAYYTSNPNSAWTASKKTTGSSSTQTHIYSIGSTDIATESLFVLCQNGNIRYVLNPTGGSGTWSARGNLPAPGSGTPVLPSYSRYVAIDRDSNGVFWAITNTSYCYKSTDIGVTWTYTGNIGVNDITSLACPAAYISEFDSIIMPIIGIVFSIFFISSKRERRIRRQ